MRANVNNKQMHILVLGQSNVASHGMPPSQSDWGQVYHQGAFSPLSDPIIGGTGKGGSVWTRFAPLLHQTGMVDDLVLSVCADGGTSVSDWSQGGKCFQKLVDEDLPSIKKCPQAVTHIVYHQGERDTLLETKTDEYIALFRPLHAVLEENFPGLPIIVCKVSHRMGVTSEEVRSAQAEIQSKMTNCIPGPDTDSLGSNFRYDDTHLNENGLEAFAGLMLESFQTQF